MSSIDPSNSPQPPSRPPEHIDRAHKTVLLVLKVIGVVALVFLIAAGIFLGTCLFGARGLRA